MCQKPTGYLKVFRGAASPQTDERRENCFLGGGWSRQVPRISKAKAAVTVVDIAERAYIARLDAIE